MSKIFSGHFQDIFRFLILGSSISILAACGASDALDLIDNIDNIDTTTDNASGTIRVKAVSSADASAIGGSFSPISGSVSSASLSFVDYDISLIAQSVVTRGLIAVIGLDGAPLAMTYGVGISSNDTKYQYTVDCDVNDCSGVSISIANNTVTLTNVTLFPSDSVDNSATASVELSGTVTYLP